MTAIKYFDDVKKSNENKIKKVDNFETKTK